MTHPDILEWFTMGLWLVISIVIAWRARRKFWVFCGSVATAAPAIAFSMYQHGLLPMGGIFHAIAAGGFALGLHGLFNAFRAPPNS
jgi:CHASE2 domain-containing sensor protein